MVIDNNSILQLYPEVELLLHSWEEDAVVFNLLSAETHLVEPRAARILERVIAGPISYLSLLDVAGMAGQGATPGTEPREYLGEVIEQFQALGLVQVLEPSSS